jgi:molybdenum cofactor synthesis domain-containing protein
MTVPDPQHDAGRLDAPRPVPAVTVIVSSDRASDGTYEDRAGPAAAEWLAARGFDVLAKTVVPDEIPALREQLEVDVARGARLVVISGGTGLGPRDVTPQMLDAACDYAIPGFGELLRAESLKYSKNAYLSRCGGWVKERALVLALPGNPKAVVEQLAILEDLLPHALDSLRGACKHRRKTAGPA